ncbi:MAG: hypothetical protein ACI4S9_01095, partial [Christensenellales bacterium]
MKRKLLASVLALSCAFTCLFVACTDTPDTPQTTTCEHELTYRAATVTCTQDGKTEYWECKLCKKYFADENATREVSA